MSDAAAHSASQDLVAWLQEWVLHEFGQGAPAGANPWVRIETTEPGWFVTISLTGTSLQEAGLREADAPDVEIDRGEDDWVHCWVDGGLDAHDLEWQGRGGASNLAEVLDLFRAWAEASRTG